MNIERMARLKEDIVNHPHEFAMREVVGVAGPEQKVIWRFSNHALPNHVIEPDKNPCGAACCAAGRAYLLFVASSMTIREFVESYARSYLGWGSVRDKATSELDLTGVQARELFYTEAWQKPFQAAYESAKSDGERAQACAGQIDYLVAQYQAELETLRAELVQ
jgi:hypothetical protein